MASDICGRYKITVGRGDEVITIPLLVSRKPENLYAACSPEHPWFSSLTFIHGVPLEFDAHGAESTLAGYIRLGTMVAYIPYSSRKPAPPWHAREFIHTTFSKDRLVPQPAYAKNPAYRYLLRDAVNTVLYHTGYNKTWSMCGIKYEHVYIDQDMSYPIMREELERIHKVWNSPNFIQRL
jgi:hypothetical protein